jgi:hypothetical protein
MTANVPLVGNVTLVVPVVFSVNEFAPVVVNEPAKVTFPFRSIVRAASLTFSRRVRAADKFLYCLK